MIEVIDVSSTKHYEMLLPEFCKKIQFNVSENCKLLFTIDPPPWTRIYITPTTTTRFYEYLVVAKYYAIDDEKELIMNTYEFTSDIRSAYIKCETLINRKLILDFQLIGERRRRPDEEYYDYCVSFAPSVTLVGSGGEVDTNLVLMTSASLQLVPMNGRVNLENTSIVALKLFVSFLESRKAPWTVETAGELLSFAVKYGIWSLKRELEEFLFDIDGVRTAHRVLLEQRPELLKDHFVKLALD